MMATNGVPGEDPKCTLVAGPFADMVQLSLAFVAIGALVVKRLYEQPRRPWLVWTLDVLKQSMGSLWAHIANLLLAMGLTTLTGGSDACAWYFINFVVDCTWGLALSLMLMKLLECWASRKPPGSWERVVILQSGFYGQPPSCRVWWWQTMVWVAVTTVTKIGALWVLVAFDQELGSWAAFLFRPLRKHPKAELVVVMVIVPCVLNVFQFWLLDNVLKSKAPTSPPAAPIAPVRDVRSAEVDVHHKPCVYKGSYSPMDVDGRVPGVSGLRICSPRRRSSFQAAPGSKRESGRRLFGSLWSALSSPSSRHDGTPRSRGAVRTSTAGSADSLTMNKGLDMVGWRGSGYGELRGGEGDDRPSSTTSEGVEEENGYMGLQEPSWLQPETLLKGRKDMYSVVS